MSIAHNMFTFSSRNSIICASLCFIVCKSMGESNTTLSLVLAHRIVLHSPIEMLSVQNSLKNLSFAEKVNEK